MSFIVVSRRGSAACSPRPCQFSSFALSRAHVHRFSTREAAKRFILRRLTWLATTPERTGGPYHIEEIP